LAVFCTKSAMVGSPLRHNALGRAWQGDAEHLPCLHGPGNMTDNYRVDGRRYQPDFIGEARLGFDSPI